MASCSNVPVEFDTSLKRLFVQLEKKEEIINLFDKYFTQYKTSLNLIFLYSIIDFETCRSMSDNLLFTR